MENNLKVQENADSLPAKTKQQVQKWSLRKIYVLICVALGNLFFGTCYGLMAPIFPAEAEKKGASATLYSIVFSIYQIAMLVSAPVYGLFMAKVTPGFMMKMGMFVSGCCVMLFGLLDHIEDGVIFITLAIIVRLIDGLGGSAFLTASYTTLGCELPDMMGRAMSITETGYALGLAAGPAIGGFIYEIGGFYLPFVVIGATLWLGVIVNIFLFRDDGNEIPQQTMKAKDMLSDIDFLMDIFAITSCFAIIGFNEASLEPHVRKLGLTPSYTGAIFLLSGFTDAVTSPFLGYLAEKVPNAQYLSISGLICLIICFLIVGPVSFLNFETNLNAVIISQFVLGLGMAALIVGSFTHGMRHFIEMGYPDSVGTYSMTSSVIFSSACFGAVVGPLIGGVLIDHFSYIRTTEVVVGFNILMVVICASRLVHRFFRST